MKKKGTFNKSILFVIIIIIPISLLYFWPSPQESSKADMLAKVRLPLTIQEINNSLNKGVEEYTHNNKHTPEKFSDFIVIKEDQYGKYLFIKNGDGITSFTDCSLQGLNSNKLTIKFSHNVTATYYLDGMHVTSVSRGTNYFNSEE